MSYVERLEDQVSGLEMDATNMQKKLEAAQWKLELEVSECKKKLEAKDAEIARLNAGINEALQFTSLQDTPHLKKIIAQLRALKEGE